RLPRANVGAAAGDCDTDGARVHPRAGLDGVLRLHARRGPARRRGVAWLRPDHGRDRHRGAVGGRRARPARAAAAPRVTTVLLALASGLEHSSYALADEWIRGPAGRARRAWR